MTKFSIKKIITFLVATLIVALTAVTFSGCTFDVNYTLATDEDGNKYYTVNLSGYASGLKGEYEIPEYYGEGDNYAPVTTIASQGFANTRISKITIPKTVTTIGSAAFYYCQLLEEVEFAEDSTLKSIPSAAFANCNLLKSINIPDSVTRIYANAFYYCGELATISLPSNLERIGMYAFNYCTSLEEITFPDTLTTIGDLSFYNCTSLKTIVIPDSVKDITDTYSSGEDAGEEYTIDGIGYGAFHTCTGVTQVVVGSGVSTLHSGVFGYMTSLETIYLPKSLKKVDGAYYRNGSLYLGHPFHSDSALETVHYAGTAAEWNEIDIDDTTASDQYSNAYSNSYLLEASKVYESTFTA